MKIAYIFRCNRASTYPTTRTMHAQLENSIQGVEGVSECAINEGVHQ